MADPRITNANTVKLAVLEVQMKEVIDELKLISSKLDQFAEHYLKRTEFELFKRNQWLERLLIVLVTVAITYLVTDFLGR